MRFTECEAEVEILKRQSKDASGVLEQEMPLLMKTLAKKVKQDDVCGLVFPVLIMFLIVPGDGVSQDD